MKWVQSGEYDRIQRGEYLNRGQETDVREEAGDAFEFYAERFRAIFRDIGENITTLGTQIGGVAEQVADWIRTARRRTSAGESRRPHPAPALTATAAEPDAPTPRG